MHKSPLMPQQRVDKNGHTVTRHVRIDPKQEKNVSIPPVQLTGDDTVERRELTASIYESCKQFIGSDHYYVQNFNREMNEFSTETLRYCKERLGNSPDQIYYAELPELLNVGRERDSGGLNEIELREYLMYAALISDCEDTHDTLRYIAGVSQYEAFKGVEDLTRLDDEKRHVAGTLTKIAFHVDCVDAIDRDFIRREDRRFNLPVTYEEDAHYLTIDELVDIVVENPDKGDAIFDYISRGIGNFENIEDIREIAEGTHGAVVDGYL